MTTVQPSGIQIDMDAATLIDSLPDALVIVDRTSTIIAFNTSAERLFRTTREVAIGQNLDVLIPARFRAAHRHHVDGFNMATETRELRDRPGIELIGLRSDGTEFQAEIAVGPIQTKNGAVSGVIVRDVSQRREYERVVLAAQAKDEFFASVSHELRTPLTSIIGYCELLENPSEDVDVDLCVRTIGRNARRERDLIDDLLFLTSSENVEHRVDCLPTDLAPVIAQALASVSPSAQSAQVKIEVVAPELAVQASIEPGLLAQAFTKILSNSIKFSDPGANVLVQLSVASSLAEIRFVDTGPGIPSSDVDRVFDRLFRGDLALRDEIQGAGLGLTIAQRIVDLFGGSIAVEPQEGRGACIVVRLPLTGAATKAASERATASVQ